MTLFSVGIIGCGSIGALKQDHIDSPNTKYPLTHAHAVYKNTNLKLAWVKDNDQYKCEVAAKKWDCQISLGGDYADVIVVAVPTDKHLETVKSICEREQKPKIIILEKPAGNSLIEATQIDFLCKENNIQVVVNYGRRFSASIQQTVKEIQEENIQSIVFYYTRGMVRDGSHAIDFINCIAGIFVDGEIVDTEPIIDYCKEDPTYCVRMKYSKCNNIVMMPLDGRVYDAFECIIMTDKGRYIFDNHFLNQFFFKAIKGNTYGDYLSLLSVYNTPTIVNVDGTYNTDLKRSLGNLYDHVLDVLNGSQSSICNMQNAIRVHAVINRLLIQKERKDNGI